MSAESVLPSESLGLGSRSSVSLAKPTQATSLRSAGAFGSSESEVKSTISMESRRGATGAGVLPLSTSRRDRTRPWA